LRGVSEYDGGVTVVIDPPRPSAAKRRPFEGWGAAAAAALSALATALIRLSGKLYGEARERGGAALSDFQARPEHSRFRAYALGGYGVLVAATLAAQFYSENSLGATVRVEKVDMPALTQVFVRNGSDEPWHDVKLTLNGIYTYETLAVQPGAFILLPVERFALFAPDGTPTFAPKSTVPKTLLIETRDKRYQAELKP
jgi:hypothetical protein